MLVFCIVLFGVFDWQYFVYWVLKGFPLLKLGCFAVNYLNENKVPVVRLPVPIPERVQNHNEKQRSDLANIGQLAGGPERKSGI